MKTPHIRDYTLPRTNQGEGFFYLKMEIKIKTATKYFFKTLANYFLNFINDTLAKSNNTYNALNGVGKCILKIFVLKVVEINMSQVRINPVNHSNISYRKI